MNRTRNTPPRADGRRRRAFSMIELLCVVGLIAVLIALLLPTLSRARGQAKLAQCSANLHQIGLARLGWQTSHDPTILYTVQWRQELAPDGDAKGQIFYCPEQDLDFDPAGTAAAAGSTTVSSSGSTPGGTSGSSPTSGTPAATQTPTRFINHPRGNNFDIPFDIPADGPFPSPFVKKRNDTGSSYELWFEDWPNGDNDYNDGGIRVTQNPDGSFTLTPIGGDSGDTHDLKDASGKVIIPGWNKPAVYNQKPPPSVYVPPPDGGSSGNGGSSGSTSGGASSTSKVITGTGESSYAMNVQQQWVMGKADKVLALDYTKTIVADPTADAAIWATGARTLPRFARHLKRLNVLYADGSVRLTPVKDLDISDPANVKAIWQP